MAKHAFIVCATGTYSPELVGMLNSLDFVGSTADVHVYGIEIEQSIVEQFSKLNYKVIYHDIPETEWQANRGRSETVLQIIILLLSAPI